FSNRSTDHCFGDAAVLRLVDVALWPARVPHLVELVQRGVHVRYSTGSALVLQPTEHGVDATVELDVGGVVTPASEAQLVLVVVLARAVVVPIEHLGVKDGSEPTCA